jgi:hypothetical protein
MFRVTAFTVLALGAVVASAHHGTASQFDEEKNIKVSGVVTKIEFVNPHSYVYFNVKNDAGGTDAWRCEMRAASVLKRSGWTQDMFKPGTQITIDGAPARREKFGCYVNDVVFGDGKKVERYQQLDGADKGDVKRTLRTADGKPNLAGNWAAAQRLLTATPGGAGAVVAGGMGGGGPGAQYKQTEAGIKASAGHQREDNPRYHCLATNIFQDWTFDQHVNKIEQSKTAIKMTYGFMDIVRTIHLNMVTHPKNIKPSRAGHSIGKWEGDTLVVDTVGFLPGYLNGTNGTKHSDKLHVVEKFTLGKEGKSLVRTWVGDDSSYLTAPFEGRDEIFASQAEYDPYNCKDLTEEVVPGF